MAGRYGLQFAATLGAPFLLQPVDWVAAAEAAVQAAGEPEHIADVARPPGRVDHCHLVEVPLAQRVLLTVVV